jgi:hypothetical protein
VNPLMTAAAGAAGGSMAGQLMDYPRQAMWGALGLPPSGAELMQQQFGMDPNSPWTHALGLGAEMLLDPFTAGGLMSGSALAAIGQGGSEAEGLATLLRAAQSAEAKNAAGGMGLLQEGMQRMGRAPIAEDLAAAGPRAGVYGLNPARSTGMEALSNVAPDVARPLPGQPGRQAIAGARQSIFDRNAAGNDSMLTKALQQYSEPAAAESADLFQLPGMQLDPNNPRRGNPLAMMDPTTAMQGINPALAQMPDVLARRRQMGPLDYAALGGTAAGALGGGMYAGYQR